MNADALVMLGKLQAAISARRWRLAYALADALDAIIDANTVDLPFLLIKAKAADRAPYDPNAPVS